MAYVYIVKCTDGSLYTGIAKDIARRLHEHVEKKKQGAKYTKSHEIESLEMLWKTESFSDAAKLEYRIKKLQRCDKNRLIGSPAAISEFFPELCECTFEVVEGASLDDFFGDGEENRTEGSN